MNRDINQNNWITNNNNQENKKLEYPGLTATESAVLSRLVSGKFFSGDQDRNCMTTERGSLFKTYSFWSN